MTLLGMTGIVFIGTTGEGKALETTAFDAPLAADPAPRVEAFAAAAPPAPTAAEAAAAPPPPPSFGLQVGAGIGAGGGTGAFAAQHSLRATMITTGWRFT